MLSVIIPTYNAAENLQSLLNDLGGIADDTVISDGGSKDDTLQIAIKSSRRIAMGASGRGWQLSRGADWAQASQSHDWLLFLHADSRLSQRALQRVTDHMMRHPLKAGYFDLRLDDEGYWPRIVEFWVRVRCFWLALPYGDQGLLIRRDLYDAIGGYPKWPLFEDVKIIQKLGRRHIRRLKAPVLTRADKYIKAGYGRRTWSNLRLAIRYLCGTPVSELAKLYK